MDVAQLFNPLSPLVHVLDQLSDPLPPVHGLDTIWEFDDITGAPIFPDQTNGIIIYLFTWVDDWWWLSLFSLVWKRFLPSTFLTTNFASTPAGISFVHGMQNGGENFTVDYDANNGECGQARVSLLSLILQNDVKKILLYDAGRFLNVTKTVAPLLPYDDIYPLQALRTTSPRKSSPGSLYNFYTFSCWESH